MLKLADGQLDLIQRIGIGDPDIALSGIAERVARDQRQILFLQQPFTEFLTLHSRDRDRGEDIESALRHMGLQTDAVELFHDVIPSLPET